MTELVKDIDQLDSLLEQVQRALSEKQPLRIRGGNSKHFLGGLVAGHDLDVSQHQGIVDYDPSELVVTVRTGTPIRALRAALQKQGQYLPFEPAEFDGMATVGGVVASGLSGPRRPWSGSVRDYVLGCRLITGEGHQLRFGGQVMKNVAGYDVSRLMVGAMGTLGVLTEVSFKLLPRPRHQAARHLSCTLEQSMEYLARWRKASFPVTGAIHENGCLHVRLEGGRSSVTQALQQIGGETEHDNFWFDLREFKLDFFQDQKARLWRVACALNAKPIEWPGQLMYDWGGAQVWIKSQAPVAEVFRLAASQGGHAVAFAHGENPGLYQELPAALLKVHHQIKRQLDPVGIFNPGRLYGSL